MVPPPIPGEPRESPKPQPIGDLSMIVLFTTCTLCVMFLIWRRADALRRVVSHQLKTITRAEGPIRLSEDDGPPAREFLEDDYDEDHEIIDGNNSDDEPLSESIRNQTRAWREPRVELEPEGGSIKVLTST